MIDLYSWTTPNGRKVHIMLQETGLEFNAHPIDIRAGDQFKPEFLEVSINNKIPAIIDHDGPDGKPMSLFESGAILFYLAEKTGQFLPTSGEARARVMEWLMFQMGGVGPMFGQANHFIVYAKDPIPYAQDRYRNEVRRLYGVMEKRLAENEYIAGKDYSIADMAIYPWCRNPERRGVPHEDFPNVLRWFNQIDSRPQVIEGNKILEGIPRAEMDDKAWEFMFGKTQYDKH
ncbi:MAG: glutathione S-transferase family protein [Rhodospirillales bacterium]|jgi:GSH-dependent disulfide-bond oxidoreductase|nr:glutathione S-transferase family protein [Rhodospirillales bacterium]MBT4007480.1 glutathione S-transferase family protein [Rhodospirillales bacterium]MBT5113194.1 glutathione S-transferase family protein [Rhodospirillales bacterium]MBT5671827.1 glutathione S-transferase family protein [Rhodospirillales bacterium]MBT6186684.1 glutathione S-transferase family protein [Rhodospirillales bacterium]